MDKSESLAWIAAHTEPGAFLKEGAFLHELIAHLGGEEHRELRNHLAKAAHEEKCIRRVMFLTVVLLMVYGAGLGYCALLLPEIFRNPTHLLMRSLSALGLGSLISQVVFLGYLFWHRAGVVRLHEECRRLILTLARAHPGATATRGPAAQVVAPSPPETREDEPSVPEVRNAQFLARSARTTW